MAEVIVRFVGPLRLFLGAPEVSIKGETLEEIRRSLEGRYGAVFKEKLPSAVVEKAPFLWDRSFFLLNGRALGKRDNPVLQDGDRIDWGLTIAGG